MKTFSKIIIISYLPFLSISDAYALQCTELIQVINSAQNNFDNLVRFSTPTHVNSTYQYSWYSMKNTFFGAMSCTLYTEVFIDDKMKESSLICEWSSSAQATTSKIINMSTEINQCFADNYAPQKSDSGKTFKDLGKTNGGDFIGNDWYIYNTSKEEKPPYIGVVLEGDISDVPDYQGVSLTISYEKNNFK